MKEKHKKGPESNRISFSEEARAMLLGFVLFLFAIVGLLGGGYIGEVIKYLFVFLFGVFFTFPLIIMILLGGYLFIFRKFPKIQIGVFLTALLLVVLGLVIGSSSHSDSSLGSVISDYNLMFSTLDLEGLHIYSINADIGGGFIGFLLYALFRDLITETGANLIWWAMLIGGLFLLIKPLVIWLLQKTHGIVKTNHPAKTKLDPSHHSKPEKVETDVPDFFNLRKNTEAKGTNPIPITPPVVGTFPGVNETTPGVGKTFDVFHDTLNVDPKRGQAPKPNASGPQPFDVFRQPLNESTPSSTTLPASKSPTKPVGTPNSPSITLPSRQTGVTQVSVTPIIETTIRRPPTEMVEQSPTPGINLGTPQSKNEVFRRVSPESIPKATEEKQKAPEIDVVSNPQPSQPVVAKTTPPVTTPQKYPLPSLSLLEDPKSVDLTPYHEKAKEMVDTLNMKFASLGIKGHVHNYIISPSFMRFEIVTESDYKINQITFLENDLMMALSAKRIKILTPIPGTPYVGIDIPLDKSITVTIKEVISAIPYNSHRSPLEVALGKDIDGRPVSLVIDKTPHLLIAGTTGSGKSACINTIITSILMSTHPTDLRMILIDPKRVEMTVYNDLPHLLCPIVTDAGKAAVALKKVVEVMESRYDLFSQNHVRAISEYNQAMRETGQPTIPYYLIIIDELSDLMLIASKDVEESIFRITQLARAAGIHLVVATQRPSVDVITGVIKSNIPSRIAFAVSSGTDSRTILDSVGAEDLLGNGDMIMSLIGQHPVRLKGAFVNDKEISRVVNHIKALEKPNYDPTFENLEPLRTEQLSLDDEFFDGEEDPDSNIYQEILEDVILTQSVSVSHIQRRFKLGHSRAGRLVDRLYEEGIIGPQIGNNVPRVIYIKSLEELKRRQEKKNGN